MEKEIKQAIRSKTTLTEFCQKNKLRISTVSDFLNGKSDIRLSTLKKIINATGITIKIGPEKS